MNSVLQRIVIATLLLFILNTTTRAQKNTINPCLPAMSAQERNALPNPENGKMLFNTSTGCINIFNKGKWKSFCESAQENNTGKVEYDSTSGSFLYFNGKNWIPFETYAAGVKRNMSKKSGDRPTKDLSGEFIGSNDEAPSKETTSPISIKDCSKKPSPANAGKDLVSTTKIELNANKPNHGVGRWIILEGDSATIQRPNSPTSMFNGLRGVTYTLRWEISTECDTSYDDILVRLRFPCDPEPSISFAGLDKHNITKCFLNANVPEVGEGSWTVIQGIGGRVQNPNDPNSKFTGVEGETYVLRWIIRTKCGYTQDDVKITFKPPCRPKPTTAEAGPDQLDVDSCILQANKPLNGEGRWVVLSGKNGKFENRFSPISSFAGKSEETYMLKWEITTECGSSADTVKVRFNKICPTVLVDIRDNKEYRVFQLKNQCWMAENLDYREVDHNCYDDDVNSCDRYGALYNWNVVSNKNSKKLCPDGWHVPSDEEWDDLNDIVGSMGEKLKLSNNDGYNIQFGGMRYENGQYSNKNQYSFFWSSTKSKEDKAWNRYYHSGNNKGIHFSANIENGFSVRCLQD